MITTAPSLLPRPKHWLVLLLACCWLLLASCTATQRTVYRERTLHDTLRISTRDTVKLLRTQRDSIYLHDSVYMEGAQLIKERFRFVWRTRFDTISRTQRDTVYVSKAQSTTQREATTQHGSALNTLLNVMVVGLSFLVTAFVLHSVWRIWRE